MTPSVLKKRWRAQLGAKALVGFFQGASRLGRLHPRANPKLHGIEVIRDVPYLPSPLPEHRMDVWRPVDRPGPWPALLYLHGGGFTILSKESHWVMALQFARKGYCVFMPNYRLAPMHKYPAAAQDCCDAYAWTARHAEEYGADVSRLVVAGESAGANLACAVTIAACYERPEPHAKKVFSTGAVPRVVLPACGILQASDGERFERRRPLPPIVSDRLRYLTAAYVGGVQDQGDGFFDLADPLVFLENAPPPDRSLPPMFISCGTRDAILEDSRRLARALDRLGVPHELQIYAGEPHAFHAFLWRPKARLCWRDHHRFLRTHL